MSLMSRAGRRGAARRWFYAWSYLLLGAAALTMVYPFLLMAAGSLRSAVDEREEGLWPRFLRCDEALFRKHVEGLFNERTDWLRIAYGQPGETFEEVALPTPTNAAMAEWWASFLRESPPPAEASVQGYLHTPLTRTRPSALRAFQRDLHRRFGGDIDLLNRTLGTDFFSWDSLHLEPVARLLRGGSGRDLPLQAAWETFRARLPRAEQVWLPATGAYRTFFLPARYGGDAEAFQAAHGTRSASFDAAALPRRVPAGPAPARADWEQFVRQVLDPRWVRMDPEAEPLYERFLAAAARASGTPGKRLPPGDDEAAFERFLAGWEDPEGGLHRLPAEAITIDAVEFRFRDYLAERFPDIDALNRSGGTAYASFADIWPPQREAHALDLQARKGFLRREFAWRNYLAVLDHLLFHGRGLWNTAWFCGLSVLLALLFMPPAAFALSRWRTPAAPRLLFLLLATMAFPPMVAQIPLFLLLRDLRLLNTFAAMLLPGMINGYFLFLLKCHYDSLPEAWFESALLDGAGGWRQFWHIALPLSKPVLAVLALHVFLLSYGSFLGALLVWQDRRLWTITLWLYQLQQRSGPGVVYASLLLAALPPLAVFLLCHRFLLRGSVLPIAE